MCCDFLGRSTGIAQDLRRSRVLRLALTRGDALVDRVADDRVYEREGRSASKQIYTRERGCIRRNLTPVQTCHSREVIAIGVLAEDRNRPRKLFDLGR